jgi:hypothetical protein
MDDATRELARAWLIKARHDLAAARKLAADPDPYREFINLCFRCCPEKSDLEV